ncbi:hypothetical protein [Microvirga sp. P5_D2]
MAPNWLRRPSLDAPASLAQVAEIIDAVSRHVQDQMQAFAEQPGSPLPAYSSMTDLLIGSYVWGLLESCIRNGRGGYPAVSEDRVRAMEEVCPRALGLGRACWVRRHLPQWEGPPAYHPAFRRELMRMERRGAHDGVYLAADDPICFAKVGSRLAFMMQLLAVPSRLERTIG